MKITVLSAHSPQWVDAHHSAIDLMIRFAHLGDEAVFFTASPNDVEPHGQDIFNRAVAGEFGAVAEYVPPTPWEIAARDNPPQRCQQMKLAAEQATHWEIMGDTVQANAWRNYYRELYALEQAPDWPMIEQWPEAPQ